MRFYIQITEVPIVSNSSQLYAWIIGGLILIVGYLVAQLKTKDKDIKNKNIEHIHDLKLFDDENKKQTEKLFETLNKLHLSMEEDKLTSNQIVKSLDSAILIIENIKSNLNGR